MGVAGSAFAAYELVEQRVLPGKHMLDVLTGGCSVPSPHLTFAQPGPSRTGHFFSVARNRMVGYTLAYPPGYGPGAVLPVAVFLHGFGGDHTSGLGGVSLAQALAGRAGGRALPPFALIAVDGGGLYWNRHPGDDPMAMLVDEVLPMCRRLGLGRSPRGIGVVGISMGAYGALLLAERHPRLIAAVAAISPAVWTSYAEARAANGGAYATAADFAEDDIVTHAAALSGLPVRIVSGDDDPFHPGVMALAKALPSSAVVEFRPGCHTGSLLRASNTRRSRFSGHTCGAGCRHDAPFARRRGRSAGRHELEPVAPRVVAEEADAPWQLLVPDDGPPCRRQLRSEVA